MRRLSVLAIVSLVSGCLPERDNPLDTSRAPAAALLVTDSGAEGACGTEPTILTVFASRGRCLSLDASGTSDPQGTPDAELSFSFFLELADGSGRLLAAEVGPVHELEHALKRELAPNQPHRFRVEVTDPSGARGVARTTFTFANGAPTAPGFSPRTLPIGGFPGSTATTFSVEFDGRSAWDPDGDDLTFLWRFRGLVVETSGEPVVVRELPVDVEARYLAELVVSDGVLSSAPSVAEVAVRTPNVWLDISADLPLRRLDSLREPVILPGAAPGDPDVRVIGFGADLVAAAYLEESSGDSVLAILDRTTAAIVTGPVALAGEPEAIAVDEVNGIVSVLEKTSPRRLSRWEASDLAPLGSHDVDEIVVEADVDPVLLVTGDGTTWVVGIFGRGAYTVTPSGTLSAPFLTEDARWVTGIAARPDSDEVWALETRDVFEQGGAGDAELVRYRPGQAPERFAVGETHANGVAFADADRLWIFLPDTGLVLVDVTRLDTFATNLALGIERVVPEVQNALLLLADRETGTCWVSGFSDTAYRVGRDFTVAAVPNLLSRTLFFVDADGALWFLAGEEGDSVIQKGHGPASDGTLATVQATAAERRTTDPRTGGVLVSRLFPPMSETRVSADGAFLWGLTLFQKELVRLDLGYTTPSIERVLSTSEVSGVFGSDLDSYVPTATGSGIWAVADQTALSEVVEVRPEGTQTHAVIAGAEAGLSLALAPETGRLCVLTQDADAGADAVRIRLLEEGATGPLDELVVFVGGSNQSLLRAGASHDLANGDVCWGVFRQTIDAVCNDGDDVFGATRVRAWRVSDGQLVDSYDDLSGHAEDAYFVSEDGFWLSTSRCAGPTVDRSYSVVRRAGGGGFVAHRFAGEAENSFLQLFGSD